MRTANFTRFNQIADRLVEQGLRWIWRGQGFEQPEEFPIQTLSMDLEPEYITIAPVRPAAKPALPSILPLKPH